MHIDTVKRLVRAMLEVLKKTDKELCAHALVLERARPKKGAPPLQGQLNQMLASENMKKLFDQKYERLLSAVDTLVEDREFLELLTEWRPSGKII